MGRRWSLLIVIVALGAFLTACSDELPSRSEFIASVKRETGDDFTKSMKEAGIDTSESNQIFEDFAGCVYDKIKDNESLLRSIADAKGNESNELEKALSDKAASCVSSFQSAIADKVGVGSNSGG